MTSKDWKKVKLENICLKVCSGGTPKSTVAEYYNGDIPWLNTKEINFNRIYNTERKITNTGFKNSSAKWIDINSIIVAMYGATAGKVAITKIPITTNQACCNLTIDNKKANYNFVYYILVQNYKVLLSMANGGAQQNLNAQQIKDFEIELPPLETQEKIAGVLSSLDDKIELNNKINQNLEQQADLLFNDLFLEDKDCIKLSEVISTTSGGTPSRKNLNFYTNGSFCWIKSKELNGTFITETEEKINQLAIEKSSAKLLPPYSVLLAMYGATVGEYAIISKQMTCNQAICAIIPNEKYPYTYIYEYIKLSKEKIKTLAIGSAQQNISQVLIKDLLVHKNINKIKEYHFKTRYLFELIKNNQIENEKLTQLRDTLLPKLMSGEIDVSKVEV